MTDIVERLRDMREYSICECAEGPHLISTEAPVELAQDAADTITTLRAEVERLRAALEPFANALKGNWSAQSGSMKIVAGPHAHDLRLEFTLADFHRAALAEEKQG